MSDYYDKIDSITDVTESGTSYITVPEEVIEHTPYRVKNQLPEDLFFVGSSTCVRDRETGALLLETRHFVAEAPTTEKELRTNPMIMRFITAAGQVVTQDEFIVDYRYMGFPTYIDVSTDKSFDTESFRTHQKEHGTVFPVAALFNMGGTVRFVGRQSLLAQAEYLMHAVDDTLSKTSLRSYVHAIRPQIRERVYTDKPAAQEQLAQEPEPDPEIVRFEAHKISSPPQIISNFVNLTGSLVALNILNSLRPQKPN